MKIGIISSGTGNLRSIYQAVYNLGYDPEFITTPKINANYSHIILPGVGSFTSVMDSMNKSGLSSLIIDHAQSGRPLLGICLGMQLFANFGDEGGGRNGLGLIPGVVKKINTQGNLSLPHIGWNNLSIKKKHKLFENIKSDVDFYFVHSYHYILDNNCYSISITEYGEMFNSVIGSGNILGLQFHPEKSQSNGLKLLENFCNWDGQC